MKKFAIFFLAIAFSTAVMAQKIGYCNSAALVQDLPEVKQADSDLQAFQAQLTKKGQEMVAALQTKAKDLEDKKAAGTISPKEYESKATDLKAEEEKIASYEQEVYAQLGKKKEELYQPVLDRVNKALTDVAKELGYLLVIDSSTGVMLYAEETLDVTKAVRTKLGLAN